MFPFVKRELAIPALLQRSHLPSLDGFRGIAIILVVISHSFNHLIYPFNGAFGVYIFFCISGFLITTLILKEKVKNGFVSLRQFYIRRVLRIFPVAYLYILVVLICNSLFNLGISSDSFLSAALYVQNTDLFNSPQDYFRHYWSLSVEEQFYMFFPLLISRRTMLYIPVIVTLLLIWPIITYLDVSNKVQSYPFHIVNQIFQYMPPIFVGSLCSVLAFCKVITIPTVAIRFRSLIVFFLFVVAGYLHGQPSVTGSTALSFNISYVLLAAMLVLSLSPGDDIVFRILNNKILTLIGVLSYSIYIWQEVFTTIRPWGNLFPGADSFWVNLPLLLLVSYVSYNFYEKRFLALKDRFR